MVACDFVGENGSNKNEENPVRSTAMRKRMASEIFDYHRFPRRTLLASDNNMACSFTTLYETLSTHRRRKEAPPLHLSEVTLPRYHGQQQQGSFGLTLNLDSAIDSLSNYSFSDSGALN
ncbi:hypothetical protein V6N13_056997 [Hibiscus sabdariffa]|uniref:Uncharacterized protein n=1 Tax=Hibiscus sabdariffa TaxID=183260 RepID=A0ABR2D2N3_9ROSI